MELTALLERDAAAIVDEALAAMQRAHADHYARAGEQATRARLQALFAAIRTAVSTRRLDTVLAHAEAVARARHPGGYVLGEVQTAYNVLEEALWRHIVADVEPARLAESLALVATAVGAAKDRLARVWVDLAADAHAPALDVAALFRGSEGV